MSQQKKLLAAIAVLVVALVVAVFLIFRDRNESDSVLTAEQLSRYEEGRIYRTIVTSTVQGKIEDKDWGLEKKVSLVHEGETDFIRTVKATTEDHDEVIIELEILRARDLEVRLDLADARLALPPAVGIMTKGARRFLLPGPEGLAAELAADRVSSWFKSDANRKKVLSRVNAAVEAVTGKGIEDHLLEAKLQPLETYEGLTADYTYEAGKGLVDFQTQATLSKEQEARVRNFSVYSEAYLLPNPDPDGPDEWDVDVRTIAHLLAPNGDLEVSGTLTVKRESTSDKGTRLRVIKGKVVFSGASDTREVLGTWAARGTLDYDLGTHSIVQGHLTGAVSLERKSTDHVLFEETFKSAPTYRIVIKGFATNDPAEARREITDEEIKR
jgi:hypothetical protein